MTGWLSTAVHTYLLHPLHADGYQFWSGIAGSFVTSTSVYAGLYIFWRKHNCHVHRCWRLAWHPHPRHGHPLCKRHHPHDPREIDHA